MEQFDAIIIGAGPAGLMAAIRAAERKKRILLVERNDTPGKKLLLAGNGRCNFTNICPQEEFLDRFSSSGVFLRNAFAQFFSSELLDFFKAHGVDWKIEEGGKVFPKSNHARDILGVLQKNLTRHGVVFATQERVCEILTQGRAIVGVRTETGICFLSSCVVLATGGISYPETGSTGDGHVLAQRLGHTILPLKPALVGILAKEKFLADWQGISLRNVSVALWADFKKIAVELGDIIFTHFGISGPAVLNLSAAAYEALERKKEVHCTINFRPDYDLEKLDLWVCRECQKYSGKNIAHILKGIFAQRMVKHFFASCSVQAHKNCNQLTLEERRRLVQGLFSFRLTVSGVMPVEQGMVTRGGVSTKEINPKTMESKLIPGLFFAGEIIDIDAQTGGYNLQAAFSTGWVCGDHL